MSKKRKLGRGLADVMDVFFLEEKKEKKEVKAPVKRKKTKKEKLLLKDKIEEIENEAYILEKAVSDELSLNLTPYEDVVYNKLYRLSFGNGKNYCQIGYGGIISCTSLRCARTANIAIEGLLKKNYIARIKIDEKERKGKGTLYRIFLACEILSKKTLEGIDIEKLDTGSADAVKT